MEPFVFDFEIQEDMEDFSKDCQAVLATCAHPNTHTFPKVLVSRSVSGSAMNLRTPSGVAVSNHLAN